MSRWSILAGQFSASVAALSALSGVQPIRSDNGATLPKPKKTFKRNARKAKKK